MPFVKRKPTKVKTQKTTRKKRREPNGKTLKGDSPDNYLPNLRAFADIVAVLQHDTPARRKLLKEAGIPPERFPDRLCKRFAQDIYEHVEDAQASETCDGPYTMNGNETHANGFNIKRLSEVEDKEAEWLWDQRLPLGDLSIICGDMDVGKSWFVLDIMARITMGRAMPDGSRNPFGKRRREVLWVTADERDSTIKHRFRLLRGELSRFSLLQFVYENDKKRAFSLSEDLERLDQLLTDRPLISVIAIDPLGAFVGKLNTHRYSDVYQMLAPIADLTEKHRVAMLPIMHLNKGDGEYAKYRVNGSVAITSGPRAAWLVSPDPDDEDRRLLLEIKNNNRIESKVGFAFRFKRPNGIKWENGPITVTADESLKQEDRSKAPARSDAMQALKIFLERSGGSVPADDIPGWAKSEGICKRTLDAAKKELGVESEKTGGSGAPWCWVLPDLKSATSKPDATFQSLRSLKSKKKKPRGKSKNAKRAKKETLQD